MITRFLSDDYMGNNIPSIGKAVMGPKKQENADSSLWHQPGILAGMIKSLDFDFAAFLVDLPLFQSIFSLDWLDRQR